MMALKQVENWESATECGSMGANGVINRKFWWHWIREQVWGPVSLFLSFLFALLSSSLLPWAHLYFAVENCGGPLFLFGGTCLFKVRVMPSLFQNRVSLCTLWWSRDFDFTFSLHFTYISLRKWEKVEASGTSNLTYFNTDIHIFHLRKNEYVSGSSTKGNVSAFYLVDFFNTLCMWLLGFLSHLFVGKVF